MNYHPITRRQSIKKLFKISGGLALTGVITWPFQKTISAWAGSTHKKFIIEGIGQNPGYSVRTLARKVFEAAGGIQKFVSKQDVVVIKPNISWARPPDLAATTNPEVLEAVVELCQEAGAKKVRIADHTIHDARRWDGGEKNRSGSGLSTIFIDAEHEVTGTPSGCLARFFAAG